MSPFKFLVPLMPLFNVGDHEFYHRTKVEAPKCDTYLDLLNMEGAYIKKCCVCVLGNGLGN